MTLLYILLFVFCLSVLIVIHEAGHLAAAKIFNVYCFEYSIGFGPLLFHKKRKNGETYFSIRAIPFGGYVSMYGEQDPKLIDPELEVSPDRSLMNIKKWKRAIIMSAGVFLNAILAMVLFFSSSLLPQNTLYLRYFDIEANSIAEKAGITEEHILHFIEPTDADNPDDQIVYASSLGLYVIDEGSYVTYPNTNTKIVAALIDTNAVSFKVRDYNSCLVFYEMKNSIIDFAHKVDAKEDSFISITMHLTMDKVNEERTDVVPAGVFELTVNVNESRELENVGLTMHMATHKNNAKEAISDAFDKFAYSSGAIWKSLGQLITGKNWDQVGGVVSIYSQTTSILNNYGLSTFIYVWGFISVNLAIFNLLPFPGLDGFHLLVVIIESITRKEISPKFKNIVSTVGMLILFAFMFIIIIKDVLALF